MFFHRWWLFSPGDRGFQGFTPWASFPVLPRGAHSTCLHSGLFYFKSSRILPNTNNEYEVTTVPVLGAPKFEQNLDLIGFDAIRLFAK